MKWPVLRNTPGANSQLSLPNHEKHQASVHYLRKPVFLLMHTTAYTPFQATLSQAGLRELGLTKQICPPHPLLSKHIVCYIQIRAEYPTPYPVMPDGTHAVYMSQQGSMIGGTLTEPKQVPLLQAGDYFGIWFYPGALRYFFKLDLSEITNQLAGRHYFNCPHFSVLHEKLYQHSSFEARAQECNTWLLKRYTHISATAFDHALALIYQRNGNERVNQLAKQVGWSARHLNRQFVQHVGVSTKTFSQVIRAQHVCQQLYRHANAFRAAQFDSGYYDQPHLIKTFKRLFALSPQSFLNRYVSDFYNQ